MTQAKNAGGDLKMNENPYLPEDYKRRLEALGYETLYARADSAAKEAVAQAGPEDFRAFNCGFAWVELRPATHPFVRWLKKNKIGDRHWSSGWMLWNPGGFAGQQVDQKVAGAQAWAKVVLDEVREGGSLDVVVGSRLD